jgi:hypothetical protein
MRKGAVGYRSRAGVMRSRRRCHYWCRHGRKKTRWVPQRSTPRINFLLRSLVQSLQHQHSSAPCSVFRHGDFAACLRVFFFPGTRHGGACVCRKVIIDPFFSIYGRCLRSPSSNDYFCVFGNKLSGNTISGCLWISQFIRGRNHRDVNGDLDFTVDSGSKPERHAHR